MVGVRERRSVADGDEAQVTVLGQEHGSTLCASAPVEPARRRHSDLLGSGAELAAVAGRTRQMRTGLERTSSTCSPGRGASQVKASP
jgi:hypothetical protein